eukprot:CAMPEP_0184680886 /NCGR_PEP_ID=MMETSP0312-20130426/3811_1 /TAXON_ID=31354 /ORGANISM="Compsopogon coeruleus, Strain SAG 36.94" /LENGTH=940 /DNA_ID=CAMNT_0027131315 /DNA_START=562 /DNA_END=3384 /DNA_ORIENTATION=-
MMEGPSHASRTKTDSGRLPASGESAGNAGALEGHGIQSLALTREDSEDTTGDIDSDPRSERRSERNGVAQIERLTPPESKKLPVLTLAREEIETRIETAYSELITSIGVIQGDILEVAEEITDAADQEDVVANAYGEVREARQNYSELRDLLKVAPRDIRHAWLSRARECQSKLQRAIDDLNELEQMASLSFDDDDIARYELQRSQEGTATLTGNIQDPSEQIQPELSRVRDSKKIERDHNISIERNLEGTYRELRESLDLAVKNLKLINDSDNANFQHDLLLGVLDSVRVSRVLHHSVREQFSNLTGEKRRMWKPKVRAARETLQSVLANLRELEKTEDERMAHRTSPSKTVRFTGLEEAQAMSETFDKLLERQSHVEELSILLSDIEDALEDMGDCATDEREVWLEELDRGIQHAWTLYSHIAEKEVDERLRNELEGRLRDATNDFETLQTEGHRVESEFYERSIAQLHIKIQDEIQQMKFKAGLFRELPDRASRQRVMEEVEDICERVKVLYSRLPSQLRKLDRESRARWASRCKEDRVVLETTKSELREARTSSLELLISINEGHDRGHLHGSVTPEAVVTADTKERRNPGEAALPQVTRLHEELRRYTEALRVDVEALETSPASGGLEQADGRLDEALDLYSNLKLEIRQLPLEIRSRWVNDVLSLKKSLNTISDCYLRLKLRHNSTEGLDGQASKPSQVEIDEMFQRERKAFCEGELDFPLDQLNDDLRHLIVSISRYFMLILEVNSVDLKLGIRDDLGERLEQTRLVYDIFRNKVRNLDDREYGEWEERAKRHQSELKKHLKKFRSVDSDLDSLDRFGKYLESTTNDRVEYRDLDLEAVLNHQRREVEMILQLSDTVYKKEEVIRMYSKVLRTSILLDQTLDTLRTMPFKDREIWFPRIQYQQRRVAAHYKLVITNLGTPLRNFEPRDLSFLQ